MLTPAKIASNIFKKSIKLLKVSQCELRQIIFKLNIYSAYTTPHPNRQICRDSNTIASGKPCEISLEDFGECSSEKSFGYKTNSPCIFIKMKKSLDWVPKVYNSSSLPAKVQTELNDAIKSNVPMIWLNCAESSKKNREDLGKIEYFPKNGFPAYFFSHANQDGYLEPLVAVYFKNILRKYL